MLEAENLSKLTHLKILISSNEATHTHTHFKACFSGITCSGCLQAQEIFTKMDTDSSGHIDFQEFRVYVVSALQQAFGKLDIDRSGHIDIDEIAPLSSMFGVKSDRDFIRKLDWDGDGKVMLDDFISYILEDSVEKLTKRKFKTGNFPKQLPILDAERVVRRLFDAHDADGSGTLDPDEVMRLAINLQVPSATARTPPPLTHSLRCFWAAVRQESDRG